MASLTDVCVTFRRTLGVCFPSCLPHKGCQKPKSPIRSSVGRVQSQMSQKQFCSKNQVDLTPGSKVTAEALPAHLFFNSCGLYCSTTHFFATHFVPASEAISQVAHLLPSGVCSLYQTHVCVCLLASRHPCSHTYTHTYVCVLLLSLSHTVSLHLLLLSHTQSLSAHTRSYKHTVALTLRVCICVCVCVCVCACLCVAVILMTLTAHTHSRLLYYLRAVLMH